MVHAPLFGHLNTWSAPVFIWLLSEQIHIANLAENKPANEGRKIILFIYLFWQHWAVRLSRSCESSPGSIDYLIWHCCQHQFVSNRGFVQSSFLSASMMSGTCDPLSVRQKYRTVYKNQLIQFFHCGDGNDRRMNHWRSHLWREKGETCFCLLSPHPRRFRSGVLLTWPALKNISI